jgi:general secretion pathway protein D
MRAQQLTEQDNGIKLMPDTDKPEMAVWGQERELPPEIQKKLDEMEPVKKQDQEQN